MRMRIGSLPIRDLRTESRPSGLCLTWSTVGLMVDVLEGGISIPVFEVSPPLWASISFNIGVPGTACLPILGVWGPVRTLGWSAELCESSNPDNELSEDREVELRLAEDLSRVSA